MISSYRLGDLILLGNLSVQEKYKILTEHPNSFGRGHFSKLIVDIRKNMDVNSINIETHAQ